MDIIMMKKWVQIEKNQKLVLMKKKINKLVMCKYIYFNNSVEPEDR